MIRFWRAGAPLTAALLIAWAGLAPTLATAGPAASPSAAPSLAAGEWPQAGSDLRADPQIRFGALPNGLRYAIRKQSIPPGQAALRLWVGAGSLQESDAQAGLAHFLEHMAFNGSKAVAEGDMVKVLERLGLAFGADTNASTNFAETIYKLDLPRTNDETVDTSLMLLRETAGALTIAPGAVDRERGVVLSEERTRDTPSYRIFKARLGFLLPGQRLPSRLPIGKVEVLKTAPASQIAEFYRRYYRPERAVLVAVGDFDPAVVEAKIRARFADWTPSGPAGGDPDLGRVRRRGAQAMVRVEPGAPLSIQIAWVSPPDLAPDTVAKRRRELVEELGLAVLNRRFSALARSASPPFLGAAVFKGDQVRSAELTLLNVNAETSGWREALTAAEREQRRALRYGVRQDELDREIVETRAALRAAVAGAATRRQAEIAGQIVESLSEPAVVTDPAQNLQLFEAAVKTLTAAEVSAALKPAFAGSGPLVFMASPHPLPGGDDTLLAEFETSRKVAVAPPSAPSRAAWPYESFGPPGQPAERREVADLGATFVRFRNGVRLTVKPTSFRDDEVLVRVNVGHGLADLPRDRQSPAWAANAFIEGGLKKIDNEDAERVLASKVYGARFAVGDDALVLSGSTRTSDLPTQLQVLAAYVAEPGWRPEAFQRLQNGGKTIHDQYESTDAGVLARDLGGLLHAGDRRWTFPSRAEIADARLQDLQAEVAPQLAGGALEVVVVGDTTVETAIEAVARTFGALPQRPDPTPVPPGERRVGFPAAAPQPLALNHKGRADQAIAYVAWPTNDYWNDPQLARDTAVLGEVMRLRLTEQLREAEGATYSPSVGYAHSTVWSGWGYLAASVEVPPAKVEGFFGELRKIAADLRTNEVSPDELARAKKPRLEGLRRIRLTNQYWLSELSGAQAEPRRLEIIRELIPGTAQVGAADVRRAAQANLKEDAAFRLMVRRTGDDPS